MAKNGNFRLLLLQVTSADQLADLPPPHVVASNIQEWQFQITIVRGHIGRLTDRSTPLVEASNGQEWQFLIAIVTGHIGRSTSRSIPLQQRILVPRNGNFRFLLLQVVQADQLAYHPPVEASSGQEWQFQIAIVKGHIGKSTGRSTPPSRGIQWPRMSISDCYCSRSYRQINWQMYLPWYRYPVARNCNFRLLFLQVIQADQLADVPPPHVEASNGQ